MSDDQNQQNLSGDERNPNDLPDNGSRSGYDDGLQNNGGIGEDPNQENIQTENREIDGNQDKILGENERPLGDLSAASKEERTCFVGNIGCKFNDDDLMRIFSVIATPESARVVRHPDGSSKGVAFVTFPTKEDAENAIKHFSTEKVEGRLFHIKPSNAPKSPQKNPRGIYNDPYYRQGPSGRGYGRPPPPDRYGRDRDYYRDSRDRYSYDRDYRDDRYRRDDRYGYSSRDRYERPYDDRDYDRRYDDRYERRYDPYEARDRRDRYYSSSYGTSGYGYDLYGQTSSSLVEPSMGMYSSVPSVLSNFGTSGYTSQDIQSMYMMGAMGSQDSKSTLGYGTTN